MALVDPNIALSYRAPEIKAPNMLAQYAQLTQLQHAQTQQEVSRMQLEKMRRDEQAIGKLMQQITSHGGPADPITASTAMINTGVPHFMDMGFKIQQTLRDTEQARAAMGLPPTTYGQPAPTPSGAVGAPAPAPALAPALIRATPELSGAVVGAPAPAPAITPTPLGAPTNVMAPAPTNAMVQAAPVMSADERRAREMLLSPNAGVRKLGEIEMTRLKPALPETIRTMTALGLPTTPEGFTQFERLKQNPGEFARVLEQLNLPPEQRRTLQMQYATKLATHAPATTVNVSTAKKYGEEFGGKLADVDMGKFTAAEKASDMADNANRIINLAANKDVFTGPAADIKLNIARALNVVGASNEESIANTEQLIAATGQSTLNAIKGAGLGTGQGFTDKDLRFLQGVAGGTINLTPKTLTELATLQHRAATQSAAKWNKRVKEIPREVVQGTGLDTAPVTVSPLTTAKKAAGVRPSGVGADWSVMIDANGNRAWVSPDRKSFIEVK